MGIGGEPRGLGEIVGFGGGEPGGWGKVGGFGVGVGVGGVSVRGPVWVASWEVFGSGSRKLYVWVI